MARKPKPLPLPHLPWLACMEQADGERISMTAEQAREAARYVKGLQLAAAEVIDRLVWVGKATDWKDGGETDRVFYWDELEPLRVALAGKETPNPAEK